MRTPSAVRHAHDRYWYLHVAFSALLLAFARLLVRRVSLSRWRWTLGRIITSDRPVCFAPSEARESRVLARSVERADVRLPFESRCLPRAVALQWRLRLAGIPSRLVIAFNKLDRSGEHGFHAWVEQGGTMIIGECDRSLYQPALTLLQGDEGRPIAPL